MKHFILPILLVVIVAIISFSSNFLPNGGDVSIKQKIEIDTFEKYDNKYIFVFFGYVGCVDVCTPKLEELSKIYQKLKYEKNVDIDTAFINLTKLENSNLAQQFASAFHKDFDGFYLKDDKLYKLQNEFNVYCAASLSTEGEYDHTAFLFLLKKDTDGYYLRRVYTQVPFNENKIINDIVKDLND